VRDWQDDQNSGHEAGLEFEIISSYIHHKSMCFVDYSLKGVSDRLHNSLVEGFNANHTHQG
jgi:hypothetical protein